MGNFNLLFWVLAAIAAALTVNNIRKIKGYNREREFANTYAKVLRQDEDAYEAVNKYVEEEKDEGLRNKGKVILAYEKMVNGEDPTSVVDDITFDPLFKEAGSFSSKLANRNGDIFVWLAIVFAKARSLSMFDIIEKLSNKMKTFDNKLTNQLEYRLFKGYSQAIAEVNDEDTEFLTKLLEGEYEGMIYEKRLIALYKRIAACFLAYIGDNIDEYYKEDLHNFASTPVGKCLMTDLELIEKYPPIEENTEEVKEEENKEETK